MSSLVSQVEDVSVDQEKVENMDDHVLRLEVASYMRSQEHVPLID